MDKKKKRKIIVLVVCLVLVVAIVTVAIILGNRDKGLDQVLMTNEDTMLFNPFVENEERSDNSLLEYGKVLSKYGDKYQKYAGEDISLNPSDFYGISYSYKGENVTVYFENKEITQISYKGKTYGYESVKNGEHKFADEDFVKTIEENTLVAFDEDYSFEYKVDISDNHDKDGYTNAAMAEERYETVTDSIPADANAVDTTNMNGEPITFIYKVNTEETALYSLSLSYFLPANRANTALMSFKINGKLPFVEAANMELKRTYSFYDVNGLDVAGNEIRARQQERFAFKTIVMSSPEGTYRNPYRFVLNKGENLISVSFSREPAVVRNISLVAPIDSATYDEYKTELGFSKDKIVNTPVENVQFEVPDEKSNMSIRMEWDGNYATTPASYKVTRYNYFGGDRWSTGGESATWSFSVPETGWYQIGFRYQTTLTDIVAYREIKIDGEIPFEEMEEYCFPYSDGWVGAPIMDENENPYFFYLEEGEHKITMTSKVGPLRASVQSLQEAMDSISTLVVQVASITGAIRNESGGYTVDANRDWDLDKHIIGIQDQIDAYRDTFTLIYNDMKESNGGALPYYGSAVSVAKVLFERLSKDLEEIPASLNDINNTLSSLSTTLTSITEQPLAIDYMIIAGENYDYSKCESTFFQNLYVGSVQFFDSFTKDYSIVGTRKETEAAESTEIEVYVARGREYVDMMRNLIAEEFTPQTGIKVKLNMINGGVEGLVMLRYVTGTAPDVAVSVNAGAPVEYAARGALVAIEDLNGDAVEGEDGKWTNLENRDDFVSFIQSGVFRDEAPAEGDDNAFVDYAFVPGLYRGLHYSFPETQNWAALFYRTDIVVDDLELPIPDTWDEVYEILPLLQENGMDFCYNYGVGNLYPFLYQNGADVYDLNGLKSALDTEIAYDAFVEYADLYNKYNVPFAANFYMKFKMGDMPIGIADMSMFCQLKYSAPEIEGKWAMSPIPGHLREDGTVDRSMGGSGTCNIIIKNKENLQAEESWEFIKWWMSNEVQAEYAAEVEATFGIGSRWNTANRNALSQMAYSTDEVAVINAMWDSFRESPIVLGGYYTMRYLTTALNQAVIQGENARIALEDAVREINKEMLRKQEEFFPEGVDSVVFEYYKTEGDEIIG